MARTTRSGQVPPAPLERRPGRGRGRVGRVTGGGRGAHQVQDHQDPQPSPSSFDSLDEEDGTSSRVSSPLSDLSSGMSYH